MKDEIKEILDRLNENKDYDDYVDYKGSYFKPLLDYITKLQEKYDIAQKDIEAMKHNYNLLVRCIENGESMTQKFENGLTYQDYKQRNEKAIEYLANCDWNCKDFENLYDILNGGDDNE